MTLTIAFVIWLTGFSVSGFWILISRINDMHPDFKLRGQIGFYIADGVILGALWPLRLSAFLWLSLIGLFYGKG